MYKPIRNLLLADLGVAALTKVLELTRQSAERGKMSSGEAKKMADDLVEEWRRQAQSFGEMLDQGIKKAVEALNLATRHEPERPVGGRVCWP